jgi:hypothetical protein
MKKHFDESEHPRGAKGTPLGGKFVKKTAKEGVSEFQSGVYNSQVGGYSVINAYLRNGEVPKWASNQGILSDQIDEHVDAIDSAFEPASKDMVLHRGVQKSEFLNSDMYTELGYTSTSKNKKKAAEFAKPLSRADTPKMIEIRVPAGFPIADVAKITGFNAGLGSIKEDEILLPRNTKFVVIKRSPSKVIVIPSM